VSSRKRLLDDEIPFSSILSCLWSARPALSSSMIRLSSTKLETSVISSSAAENRKLGKVADEDAGPREGDEELEVEDVLRLP
jgi:hypothetical protein